MKKKTKNIVVKIFAATAIVLLLSGFTISTTALALIPNWTQELRFSDDIHDNNPIEPIPAFISGLKRKLER